MTVGTGARWIHDDCGQEVNENADGWQHVVDVPECTGLYDCAVIGVSIHPAPPNPSTVPADLVFTHDDCHQAVIEEDHEWYHLDNQTGCTTLRDAIPGINITAGPPSPNNSVTDPAWIHDVCGFEVVDHEDGWRHTDDHTGCHDLNWAIPGFNITHGPTTPTNPVPSDPIDAARAIAASTVPAARRADNLAATLSPADLYQLFRKLESKVQSASYPPLTITRRDLTDLTDLTELDIDEIGLFEFTCPHCGNVRDEMTSLQVSFLGQDSDEIREYGASANEIHFDYETDPGFSDLVYLSSCCEQPVAMPAGWVEG